ncbi:MerR family transcriptional regulator [Acetobacter sp. LMG 1627]|uniref:MerR family transcriptional regulator n=1 Tax=Acetobacter conturbans TaxID=1737472 RepID=A0ABX0K1W8_9PROT|nr:MerR family transcriptional regulator [Acetobacter conturbans]NHN89732.1 MerR family transcriptional regulator [Acetobacter conturbans]
MSGETEANGLDDAAESEADFRNRKGPLAFRTISEVADELKVPQHVLRFWETRFDQVRPLKRGGGRRYYRPEDVDLLRRIATLLYVKGYTIKGVQRVLREKGAEGLEEEVSGSGMSVADEASDPPEVPTIIESVTENVSTSFPEPEIVTVTVRDERTDEENAVMRASLEHVLERLEAVKAVLVSN